MQETEIQGVIKRLAEVDPVRFRPVSDYVLFFTENDTVYPLRYDKDLGWDWESQNNLKVVAWWMLSKMQERFLEFEAESVKDEPACIDKAGGLEYENLDRFMSGSRADLSPEKVIRGYVAWKELVK